MKLFWSLRPPYTVELMLIVIFTLALLIVGALADPVIPDDKTKTEALKLGYVLNGNSMVRWGSLDLSSPGTLIIPNIVKTNPVIPDRKRKQ